MPDFLPTASLDILRRRAELLKQVRRFFDDRGFLEVETPILSHDTVIDRHLDPLAVRLFSDPRQPEQGQRLWLQTSPEFGMKRLLAAGNVERAHPESALTANVGRGSPDSALTAIYQITRAFRGGETGPLHNPEFTMLEWYRVGDDYEAGIHLLGELASAVFGCSEPKRLTFRDAFLRYAKIDPFGQLDAALLPSELPVNADRDVILDYLHTTRVEPQLGLDQPTILYDYPATQSALARIRPGNPPVAERFELYFRGVELANGYHELLDPAALADRNRENNRLRAADGKYTLPDDSRLLASMQHGLPPCSGCALGFDRLVMVATGVKSIRDVMAFPIERA